MSNQVQDQATEELALRAFNKVHNPDNSTSERDALDILGTLSSPSTVRDKDKSTLLHYACYNGWYRVTKELIKHLCDPNSEDDTGTIPLHLACRSNNLDLVKYLVLKKHCDPNIRNSLGLVPLHNAASVGCLDIAKYLIEEKQCSSTPTDKDGMTPLHFASHNGHLHVVKYLVEERKCNAACVTSDYFTAPLHLACQNGHLDVAKYLVEEKHCKPTSLNGDGFQSLHLACQNGHLNLAKYLIEEQQCYPDCYNLSYKFLHWTPLHLACASGHLKVAKYLIEIKKCNPSCKDNDGLTPLHLASRNGHLNVVKYLITEQHCDPACKKKNGCSPLHSACQNGHIDVSKYLIEEQRVHPTCISVTKWTPLHLACDEGHLDLVRYLVDERHCDPHSKTYHGDSPLSLAYKSRHLQLIVYLVKECMCSALDSGITLTDHVVKNHAEIALFLVTSSNLTYQPINIEVKNTLMFHPAFKVYVVGHESAGKSTFIKAIRSHLKGDAYWITKHFKWFVERKMSDVFPPTAGIVPVHVQSYSQPQSRIIMYDFAGKTEYHSSHAAFLENITSSQGSLVMIVFDLSKNLRECVFEVQYWMSFTDIQFKKVHHQSHPILIVASHADIVKSQGEIPDNKAKQVLDMAFGTRNISYDIVVADCKVEISDGVNTVSAKILSLYHIYYKEFNVSIQDHFLKYVLRKDQVHRSVASKFMDVKSLICTKQNILDDSGLIPTENDELSCHLTTLSENGELLFLRSKDINKCWVIFNVDFLLGEMNSTLFAPDSLMQLSNNTGVVSLTDIKTVFPNHDPQILARIMTHLELCCEINESEAKLISRDEERFSRSTEVETYYFFPALVSTEMLLEDSIILISHYKCGWQYQRVNDYQFITSRFTHTMLTKLITEFLTLECENVHQSKATQRMCTVWKTGIQWQNSYGIQAVVKVVDITVLVEVGCLERREDCLHYRSKLIEAIVQVKQKSLGATEMREFLIEPEELSTETETIDRKG